MDKFEKLQFLQPKIDEINYLIESYFNAYPNETTVKAKALEEFARSRGHNISQETIRETLRQLDGLGELKRIPHVNPVRRRIKTSWEFSKEELFQGIE